MTQSYSPIGNPDSVARDAFLSHFHEVRNFARWFCRDPFLADDLTGIAFTNMYAAMKRGKGPRRGGYITYLTTCVRNEFISHQRREVSRSATVDRFAHEESRLAPHVYEKSWAEPDDVTHVRFALRESFEILTDHEKLVLHRVILDGRRPKEVALEIGIGANAVSACKLRALRKIRLSFIEKLLDRLSVDQRGDLREIVGDFRNSA